MTGSEDAASIVAKLGSYDRESFRSNVDRKSVLNEARKLISRIETPWETGFRLTYTNPACLACLRVATQLGFFKSWKEKGGQPSPISELLKLVSCDGVLFERILCELAATEILDVVQPGIFGMTNFAESLAEPLISSTIDLYFEAQGLGLLHLPKFLADTGYQNPTDSVESNFKSSHGVSIWEFFKQNPKTQMAFGTVLHAYASNRGKLADVYPVDNLLRKAGDDTVLLVDCGGNIGYDIEAFRKAYPQPSGKLVLQDLPEVIGSITGLDSTIQKMDFDLFKPQPVQGAAAYYFHFIFHDWPDSEAEKILAALKPSMKQGYSKLLIHDVVLDPLLPSAEGGSSSDIIMMAGVSASERTAPRWRDLLDSSGFDIIKIHTSPSQAESVIEAEPK